MWEFFILSRPTNFNTLKKRINAVDYFLNNIHKHLYTFLKLLNNINNNHMATIA